MERLKPFCVTELALGQVLTKMNVTFLNRKNAKIKGSLNGCDQIKSILQMTKTNDTLSLPFTTQWHFPQHDGVKPLKSL